MFEFEGDSTVVESDTLYDAIYHDRRLTTRNVVRWIDQLLNTVLLFHKAYLTVGEFGISDIRLGPEASIASTRAFADNLLNLLKGGQHVNSSLDFSAAPQSPKRKTENIPDKGRGAALDFHRRITAATADLSQAGSTENLTLRPQSPEKARKRLPQGFDCQWMTKLDIRHDNNICIQ